jgi:integrase/recombinase XerD
MESAADPTKRQIKPAITIVEAVSSFRADEDGRCLEKTTVAQSRSLFENQLLNWAVERGLILLTELTTPELTKFRASWGNGPNTTKRKHERLVGFFNFCIANDWLEKNPAARMKRVEEKRVPTDYFTREEFERVVDVTYAYRDWQGGHDFHARQKRMRALVLLMLWSGLAIKDAVTLEKQRLGKDERTVSVPSQNRSPVYVPLPEDLVEMLHALPNSNPRYFFWSGKGDPETVKKGWQRTLRHLFREFAKITNPDGSPKRCHPHMFRDTFAVELLLSGVPIDQVSLLLGHGSVKVTEKHYAPLCKGAAGAA